MSIYRGQPATPDEIAVGLTRLRVAFPKMAPEFFSLLSERIVANRFTGDRLKDAVNHLIDNFSYRELNVSDIVKYDKRCRLYTYNEVCSMVSKGQAQFADFKVIELEGKPFRVKITDAAADAQLKKGRQKT